MNNDFDRYFQDHVGDTRRWMLGFLAEAVRQRTVNVTSDELPFHPYLKSRGEEYRVGDLVRRELYGMKIRHDVFSRDRSRPNIIARVGANRTGERLLVAAHMDVVPAGEGWNTDPFEMVERGGKVYGRGVLDNKGPLAAALAAVRALEMSGAAASLGGELQVAALSDEEAHDPDGVDYGIGFLMEEKKIDATMAVIPDVGENLQRIDVAEKGTSFIKVTATGRPAHGSTPEMGVNAVYAMARLVREIEVLQLPHTAHPVLGSPTLNLGQISGGVAPNIVPGECVAKLDVRIVPGMTPEGVMDAVRDCCVRVGGEFRVEKISSSLPHSVDPDNVLVHAIQSACERCLGSRPTTFGMGGATFAKTLNLGGIPAVGWGPGDDAAFHVFDEYVEIDQLLNFARVLAVMAAELLL